MGRGNSLKVLSVIVFLFAAVLMMGQLPAGKLKAFANNSCGPTGVDSYIKIDKGDGNPVLIYKGNNSGFGSYTFGTVQGISYDKESNTITVKNLNKPKWSIETDEMGVDLKLNVVGTCALKSIYIQGGKNSWGAGLCVTGSGSLTLNASRTAKNGVFIDAEYTYAVFRLEGGVDLSSSGSSTNVYDKDNKPINVLHSLSREAIVLPTETKLIKTTGSISMNETRDMVVLQDASFKLIRLTDTMGKDVSDRFAYPTKMENGIQKYTIYEIVSDAKFGKCASPVSGKVNIDPETAGYRLKYDIYDKRVFTSDSYIRLDYLKETTFDVYKNNSTGKTTYIKLWDNKYYVAEPVTVCGKEYGNAAVYDKKAFDISKYSPVGEKYDTYSYVTKDTVINIEGIVGGQCGDNATWSFDKNSGLMMISGSGDMYDYKYSTRTPWLKYREDFKKVVIGDGITRIGTNTFYGCKNLKTVEGCKNVKSIGINTFRNCYVLTRVEGCSKADLIEQYAFCGSTAFGGIGSEEGTVNIPVCKKIGGYTFYECKGIRKLITSDDMNYIGTRAFSNCTSMLEVNVGSGCSIIGSYAFCGNTSLTKVTGCKGLTGIGDFAFYGNTVLSTVEGCVKVTNLGKSIFRNCNALTRVGAADGKLTFTAARSVGEYAFSGCKSATLIDTGTAVTVIGQYAFQNTTSLKKLYLRSAKIGTVGEYALKGINAGAVIYVPKSVLGKYSTGIFKNKGQAAGVRFSGI